MIGADPAPKSADPSPLDISPDIKRACTLAHAVDALLAGGLVEDARVILGIVRAILDACSGATDASERLASGDAS